MPRRKLDNGDNSAAAPNSKSHKSVAAQRAKTARHAAAPRVVLITMGCSKNLVDSERLYRLFQERGLSVCHNPPQVKGDYAVINTCGFISDAKEESIDMILQCCQAKEAGRLKGVYVMGCLSQRYADELPNEIPEVDGWFGKFDWQGVVDAIAPASAPSDPLPAWERTLTTPPHSAYLKIAEGCNRFCAYCAIPIITGRYTSRPIEEIIDEVRALVARGVKEFNVIAQDLNTYGTDLYGRQRIADLVDAMAQVPGVEWIRLHYAYPSDFPMDLLPVMARHDNVCKYLDIALQHVSDVVLDNMRRHIDGDSTRRLLDVIRKEVPGIHLRTTLMVGFPGEGEKEFAELLDFVREQRFERMGAFAYCEEDDTYAAKHFPDDIPQEVKDSRLAQLMELQQDIALEVNESKVGQTLKVIVDSEGDDYYVARSEFDSPEVDPEVLIIKDVKLTVGEMYYVTVTQAMPFEIIARVADNNSH